MGRGVAQVWTARAKTEMEDIYITVAVVSMVMMVHRYESVQS